jgi:hypothetical protein
VHTTIQALIRVLVLGAAAAACLAAAPADPRWVPLSGSNAAPPVLDWSPGPDRLACTLSVPGLLASTRILASGAFSELELPGAGIVATVGAPALPVVRRLVVAPDDAAVTLEYAGPALPIPLSQLGLTQPIRPAQRPVPKIPGAAAPAPFERDASLYDSAAPFPAEPVRVREAGRLHGRRLLLLELHPVLYRPANGELLIYPKLSVTLSFSGGAKAAAPLTADEQQALQASAIGLEEPAPPAPATTSRRLLIIAYDSLTNGLASFIGAKTAQGWQVDLFGATQAGATAIPIQTFIKARYGNLETRPAALLLVGDTRQVPCFSGTVSDTPDTDLYYACMDGADDWLPEFPVGRFSATNGPQLATVIAKSLAYEQTPGGGWTTQAAFIATSDTDFFDVAEGTHDFVISNYFAPRGYASDKLYSVTYHASSLQVRRAFNAGRAFGVYSGHGSDTSWAGPALSAQDVYALTNAGRYPVVLSFACLTGHYGLDECFAETWQRAPGGGAAAVLASSVNSYWDEDDILERRLFAAIFADGQPTLAGALNRAKLLFLEHFGVAEMTRRYFEMYNLFGDPAADLNGLPFGLSTNAPPSAFVGAPYQFALVAVGGRRPYQMALTSGALPPGLALDPGACTLSGSATVPGSYAFAIAATDAVASVATATYPLTVCHPLTVAVPAVLLPGATNHPYRLGLQATGGAAPLTWSARPTFQATKAASAWTPGGTAKGWRADDACWSLPLPWPFPFCGSARTSLWVCSNGYLDFANSTAAWNNAASALAAQARIAPLWDDLYPASPSDDIFVATNATQIRIRWAYHLFGATSIPVNVEAVLNRDGSILFDYGPGNSNLTATVGIGVAPSGEAAIPDPSTVQVPANTRRQFTPLLLPPGLACSSNGLLSGLPTTPGAHTFRITVTDQALPPQTTSVVAQLRIDAAWNATTNGTPLAWLAYYDLTAKTADAEDLEDRDGDGMPAWAEYRAGTDPTHAASALRLLEAVASNGQVRLAWRSAESWVEPVPPYGVWTTTNLLAGPWQCLTNIPERTPPQNEVLLPLPSAHPAHFYRLTIPGGP